MKVPKRAPMATPTPTTNCGSLLDKKITKEAKPNISLNYVPRKQLIATVHQLSMLTQMGPHSKRQ